jgi:hypothetical protein
LIPDAISPDHPEGDPAMLTGALARIQVGMDGGATTTPDSSATGTECYGDDTQTWTQNLLALDPAAVSCPNGAP